MLKQAMPWWLKIGIKIALSRLPVSYALWKRIGLFEHGDMNNPQRAYDTILAHAKTATLIDESDSPHFNVQSCNDFSVLELGPGDSVFTAVIVHALGASRSWLVDSGNFATDNPHTYEQLWRFMASRCYVMPSEHAPASVHQLLDACNAIYLSEGVRSLTHIPDHSIDFCFSNAVLEHIPRNDFPLMVDELRRVLKKDGICVHRVDLKDHLGGGLNNLRFSEQTWESSLFHNSGFYTNRFRFSEMLALFDQAHFAYELPRIVCWEHLPLNRSALAAPFARLSDSDLLVNGFDVVLRCKE